MMAQLAVVESRQACSYDEVVRPMESSSICVDAVVSSSAASQAQLSSANAAESQFARTQRSGSRGETIKENHGFVLLRRRCCTRMKQF
jgi:hypothetical protein